jgi:hypothetical protein
MGLTLLVFSLFLSCYTVLTAQKVHTEGGAYDVKNAPQGDLNPCCRRESSAKKPYSAILNLFNPFQTHLNGIKSRLDLKQ